MNKNILLVSATAYTDQIYQTFADLRTQGYRLYLLSDGSFEPRTDSFDQHFKFDLRKSKATVEYIKKQGIKFDAVTLQFSDLLTPLTALLAKEFGCIGNDPTTAFNCRSKYHMRKKFLEKGIPSPQFRLCRNYNELEKAVEEIGFPCIAKPVGVSTSYGVFSIMDASSMKDLRFNYESSINFLKKKEAAEDFFNFSEEEYRMMGIEEPINMITDYLVEEFMDGPEISVDAMVHKGNVTIFGIEDQVRMPPPYVLQTAARLPYVCDSRRESEIYELICQTVQALGIQNSATHTEIIFTKEGPKIVEIGCRIGGDDLHQTILDVTGYNLMYESIMVALGIKRNYSIPTLCHTAMQFILPKKTGVIRKIDIPRHLMSNPNISEITIYAEIGEGVAPPPVCFDYLGYVSVKAETPDQAQHKLKEAIGQIEITIEND